MKIDQPLKNIRIMSIIVEPVKSPILDKGENTFDEILAEATKLAINTGSEISLDMTETRFRINVDKQNTGGAKGRPFQEFNKVMPQDVHVKKKGGVYQIYFPSCSVMDLNLIPDLAERPDALMDFLIDKGFRGDTCGKILYLIQNLNKE